jgi:hypothetical protein
MRRYNPNLEPDPEAWLALDEAKRLALVADYHRRKRIWMPEQDMHAAIHVVVENQAAMGDELPVRRTIERLRGQGLNRHDAVHAVGCILLDEMSATAQPGAMGDFNSLLYNARLEALTAESWRREFGEQD